MLRSRIIGPLLTALVLLVLAGCSTFKLAYNNAPELVYWWLDGYVDLDDAQSRRVRNELARLALWHRANELPKFEELLIRAEKAVAGPVTPAQVCALAQDARQRLLALNQEAEPAYVALAMDFTVEQLAHLSTRFDQSNREWRENWIEGGAEQRLVRRLKSARARSEDFYGSLRDDQIDRLRATLARTDFDAELNYAERLRRQRDLLRTLRRANALDGAAAGSSADVAAALRGYLARSLGSPNPSYRAWADKAIQDSCALVADLHNGASAEQRARAGKRIAAYLRDVRELASTSGR